MTTQEPHGLILWLLKMKQLVYLKLLSKMAQTQFSATVKFFRTDNALELSSSTTALEFFADNGILHQTSCVQAL